MSRGAYVITFLIS
ncbi:hypothetical protein EYZ11_008618 [Aspergillus tanneri]|uniref:Uncharacterized protein n=1 Tax=Aspergillus tanneri TaxID=1220188 RepID=A0A4S3JAD6_9EURO|nr:hypothetical protein EYZ11_008618 [Aspergillus tanneri]